MSNVFLISDTHFFHQRILEFEKDLRPFSSVEEMNEALVDNWNRIITKRDTVWHLGDVCFGPVANLSIIDRLNGTKNLVMGNHDQYGVREYIKYFNKIEAAKKYDSYLLSHVPIHPDQFYRFKGNVHGHLHSKRVMTSEYEPPYTGGPDTRYFNVSCEHHGLAPVAWEEIKRRM